MAIDFSLIGGTLAKTGKIDFSAIGGIPAVGQDTDTDETTALGAVGRGAASMIPLGTQALAATAGAMQNEPYLQERREIEKETAEDIANHPVARLAGQGAGIALPALITGGSSVPESVLGAAGQGAAIGAGFGAGNAIDTLAGGGSRAQAAGQVALGAGLGAAGGAAGQKIAQALEGTVPGIEEFAAKKAAQGVGMGSDELGNMSQQELIDTGKMLMDKGIVRQGASTQEMFDTAKGLQEGYGDTIGQIGSQAKELGLTTDVKPMLDSLEAKFQAADALQNPDERKAAIFYKRGMADILTMARQNLPEGTEGIADTLENMRAAGIGATSEAPVPTQITFDQLQRLKKSYGNSAFENGAVKNPAAADIYSQLSAGQKAIIESTKSNPDLPGQLKDAMAGYSKLYPVVDGLQDVLGRERAGNMPAKGFGMIGKLVGQLPGQSNPAINALTSLGLLGAGHPLWAVGAATATLQNPRAMSTIAQGVANAIPEVGAALPTAGAQIAAGPVHQNMGETKPMASAPAQKGTAGASTTLDTAHPALAPWKPVFQKNAANATNDGEVQKSNAVTDFVLSQRDPAYAAAKQKISEKQPSPTQATETTKMADGGVAFKSGKGQFNEDMKDKLNEFLRSQKEKGDAQPR